MSYAYPTGEVNAPLYYATRVVWSPKYGITFTSNPSAVGSITAVLQRAGGATLTAFPNRYELRDFSGTVVGTGTVTSANLTVAPPTGGWLYGWYRVFMYLDSGVDPDYGISAGASNIVIARSLGNLPIDVTQNGNPGGVASQDLAIQGILAAFPARFAINNVATPSVVIGGWNDLTNIGADLAVCNTTYYPQGADAARPREQVLSFPSGAIDSIQPGGFLNFYIKDGTVNGSTTFVTVGPGSGSGSKVQVYSPTSTALVETFDNIASGTGQAVINATSAYVRAFGGGGVLATVTGPTAIGNGRYAGVSACSSYCYPRGIQWYEGPSNEPSAPSSIAQAAEMVHQLHILSNAVKAGNASAKVLGPNFVSIYPVQVGYLLDAGAATWLDGLSFHGYNTLGVGDANLSRRGLKQLRAVLDARGWTKPVWQTEQGVNGLGSSGVSHWRRSRWALLDVLSLDQVGVTKERNCYWYMISHGFWGYYPVWMVNGDNSVNPHGAMYRVLSEELWGRAYASALTFGAAGDDLYLGNVYGPAADGTRVLAFMPCSPMPEARVFFKLAGSVPSTVTVIDQFGNGSTVGVSGGTATVPCPDGVVYMRLPTGCTATVFSHGTWNPVVAKQDQFPNDDPRTYYNVSAGVNTGLSSLVSGMVTSPRDSGMYMNGAALPVDVEVFSGRPFRVDRVVVFSGAPWQTSGALTDFDLYTRDTGGTWSLRATRTVIPTSMAYTTNNTQLNSQRETFWDERSVFDIPLTAPIVATGVRLRIRATSSGGEPDAACLTVAGGAAGAAQNVNIRAIQVWCDDNSVLHYLS